MKMELEYLLISRGVTNVMKRLMTFIAILIILGVLLYIMKFSIFDLLGSEKDDIKIGKPFSIHVDSNMLADYKMVEKLKLWEKTEKNKMVDYMKNNNLRIKVGDYQLNQTTSFEDALKILTFEKIE